MIRVKAYYHKDRIIVKPTDFRFNTENNFRSKTMDIEDFERDVCNGNLSFKEATWTGKFDKATDIVRSLWVLDFDSGITPQEVCDKCDAQGLPHPNLMYWSLRADPSNNIYKFRCLWYIEPTPQSLGEYERWEDLKGILFPERDPQAVGKNRMYLTGKSRVILDENATTSPRSRVQNNFTQTGTCVIDIYITQPPVVAKLFLERACEAKVPKKRDAMLPAPANVNGKIYRWDDVTWDATIATYPLIRDFYMGKKLIDSDLMKVAILHAQVKGGKERFFAVMHLVTGVVDYTGDAFKYSTDKVEHFKKQWSRYKSMEVCIMQKFNGNHGCPLNTRDDAYRTSEYKTLPNTPENIITVRGHLYNALRQHDGGTTLINAQCGIGKTTTLLQWLYDSGTKALYAGPTHKMVREKYNDFIALGGTALIYPELQCSDQRHAITYNAYAAAGLKELAKEYLEACSKHDKGVQRYLNELYTLGNEGKNAQVIFMTHARLKVQPTITRDRLLIIDEDLINQNSTCIDFKDLTKFQATIRDHELLKPLHPLLLKQGQYAYTPLMFSKEERKALIEAGIEAKVNMNLFTLFSSNACVTIPHTTNKNITYIYTVNPIPKALWNNTVILSADDIKPLYEIFIPDIKFIQIDELTYLQKPVQVVANFGAGRIEMNLNNVKAIIDNIQDGTFNIISAKKFKDAFGSKGTFGSLEGRNDLQSNLIVVGDNRPPQSAIVLLYASLYGEVPESVLMSTCRLNTNGISHLMYTYQDMRCRMLCNYWLSKNLEQALGRARLLNNDYKVVVLAQYPVKQCLLRSIDVDLSIKPSYTESLPESAPFIKGYIYPTEPTEAHDWF